MQSIPDGVDLYVHRLIHESLTEELLREYHSKYICHVKTDQLLSSNNYIMCNYRNIHKLRFDSDKFICGLSYASSTIRLDDNNNPVCLPKRYIFSSGMNSLTGCN